MTATAAIGRDAERVSRSGVKTASRQPTLADKRPLAWSDVLAALSSDEARSLAIARYRAAGFTPDEFGAPQKTTGRQRHAREAMADALTRTEDTLEYLSIDHRRGRAERDAVRLAIRTVRRRLELELWP